MGLTNTQNPYIMASNASSRASVREEKKSEAEQGEQPDASKSSLAPQIIDAMTDSRDENSEAAEFVATATVELPSVEPISGRDDISVSR